MSPVNKYKKIENRFMDSVNKSIRLFFSSILSYLKLFIRKGKQRFTVMFIPHSEKKIFNFHISVFALSFLLFLLVVLIIAVFGLSTYFTGENRDLSQTRRDLSLSEKALDKFIDKSNTVSQKWLKFETVMNELLSVVGTEYTSQYLSSQGQGGDSSDFISIDSLGDIEISKLNEIEKDIENIIGPVEEIIKLIQAQKELLTDIPTLWPIKGKGNITAIFGVEEDPFTKGFRLHRGIDIAWSYDTPILATANGEVVNVRVDSGLGLLVKIEHKYGFYTRYGHMNEIIVEKGQKVVRGQIIGYMGSTGKSTGPHLHYEVWIGTKVVDPMDYLDIMSPLIDN